MKLTTVIGSVNNNPDYYLFIPKQIKFWGHFNIKFIAIFVGNELPADLIEYSNNIILWKATPELNSVYVGQNIRILMPALLNLPDDEMVMITDMDMLPCNDKYYTEGLDKLNKEDFVYYREVDIHNKQIFMCYNAAHPSTWSKIFGIRNTIDIINFLNKYKPIENFNGEPGSEGWYTDQLILYDRLINYSNLVVLNREIKRLEMFQFAYFLSNGINYFYSYFDDAHFHRSFSKNKNFIEHAELQLFGK